MKVFKVIKFYLYGISQDNIKEWSTGKQLKHPSKKFLKSRVHRSQARWERVQESEVTLAKALPPLGLSQQVLVT